eukprot:CAMPEP_0176347712 /NCGR_PEP_ID=MMETSP0126-20121128/7284_1 /TAXON_ID=141414 ORGANISM="Strombidinopsis acuminatum, Strain SPMC142" /NCGR_SAMPLE_ID=MMETSP0126 /ASSEMBLY_ACC=CAM_ASM_000229 /LENGTH=32 /DNA_ID= /DNA_START= /DNA_END= /DNA_ORIENTATION=
MTEDNCFSSYTLARRYNEETAVKIWLDNPDYN